jgi:hypothetical protein
MVTIRTMRGTIGAGAIVLAGILAASGARAVTAYGEGDRYDYLCTPTHTWPAAPGCCEDAFDTECTASGGHPDVTDRRNILLVVSDDQDYCLYGFMAGVCSKQDGNGEYVSCLSEDACDPDAEPVGGPGGRCVGSRDLGTCDGDGSTSCYVDCDCGCDPGDCNLGVPPSGSAAPPLRLNDLTCRNRQPKRRKRNLQWCDPNDDYEKKLDRKRLQFSREGAPCRRGNDEMPIDAHPVLFTPHLDTLAASGAVFPRAYVAGTICKNSRRAMLHGRYLRHLQWLWENQGKGSYECERDDVAAERKGCRTEKEQGNCTDSCEPAHTMAWWLNSDRVSTPSTVSLPASDDGYERLAFAKLDVMKPGRGGFAPKGSSDSHGSRTGRGSAAGLVDIPYVG